MAGGLLAVAALLATRRIAPEALILPLEPLGWPALPTPALLGLLLAASPAVLTPPPRTTRALPRARTRDEVSV